MIYYTGDTHGGKTKIINFYHRMGLTAEDTIVILGDAGMNYYGDVRDEFLKNCLDRLGITIFSIHGNHEMRPASLPTYITKQWRGGTVWYEESYPNLLFAKDGEMYDLDGQKSIVIGGAYSVDKFYRLERGYNWFADEQPSDEIKADVEAALDRLGWKVDQVLSHTCPTKYTPTEAFLPGLDQSSVDRSTEDWLDTIEERLTYKRWFCGHWHIDKHIDRLRFLMNSFECSEGGNE